MCLIACLFVCLFVCCCLLFVVCSLLFVVRGLSLFVVVVVVVVVVLVVVVVVVVAVVIVFRPGDVPTVLAVMIPSNNFDLVIYFTSLERGMYRLLEVLSKIQVRNALSIFS